MASCAAHPMYRATELQVQRVFIKGKEGQQDRYVKMPRWVCKLDVKKAAVDTQSAHDQALLAQIAALTSRLDAIEERKAEKAARAGKKPAATADAVDEAEKEG